MVTRFQRLDQTSCNPLHLGIQLTDALNVPITCDIDGDEVIVYEDISGREAEAQAVIDAYVYDPEWVFTSEERDWRTLLQREIEFIAGQLETWPDDATTNAQALQRVNFLLSAQERMGRDLLRLLRYIRDDVMDASD